MYIITILTIVDMIYKEWTPQNFPWGVHTVCMNTSHPTLTFVLDVISMHLTIFPARLNMRFFLKPTKACCWSANPPLGILQKADYPSSIWFLIRNLKMSLMNSCCERSGVPYRWNSANRQLVSLTASRNWKVRLGHRTFFHVYYSARGNTRIPFLASTASLN